MRPAMEFKTPLILLLIPIVLVLLWLQYRRKQEAAFTFSSLSLVKDFARSWKMRFSFIPSLLRVLALLLVVVALAGPRQVLEESQITTEGIDIVLSLDCSGSMAAEDFTINGQRLNRLEIIKKVVDEFIKQRKYDKLGLVVFGARAYTICPLTSDHQWLSANLDRVKIGIVEDGTAIGSGIASAVGRLKQSQAKSKVIVLLTDGMNNAGKMDPLEAAKTAKALGVKIYTIGAGTKGLAPFPVTDVFGRKFYQNVQIDIDEDTLTKIAQMTGGQYFRATDTESLRQIYQQIDKLEKTKIEEKGYKQYQELFVVFLTAALILILVEVVLINSIFLKVP